MTALRVRRVAGIGGPPLALALAWCIPGAALLWAISLWRPPTSLAEAALTLAAVVLPACALWWVARAGQQAGLALASLAGVVVLLSDATLRPGTGGTSAGLDAQSVLKFGLWSLGLLLLFWRRQVVLAALRHPPCAALAALVVWSLCSALWSITPAYSAAAALALAGVWVLATVFAAGFTRRQGTAVIALALVGTLVASLVLYLLVPARALTVTEGGLNLRLSGVYGSPNNLGRAAALAALLVLMSVGALRRWQGAAVLLLALPLCATCLLMSGNRGAALALVGAWGVYLLAGRPWQLALAALTLLFSVAVLALAPELRADLAGLLSRSGRRNEITTLTGRTDIWAAVIGLIREAPLLGHGFASTRELLPAAWWTAYGWTTTSAHNLWLQVAVTTGFVGLALLLLGQLAWAWQALHRPQPARDAVFVFVLVIGLLESSAGGPSVNLLSFVLAWAAAPGLQEARRHA
ncbi:MAG: O-antigen ligase family protein [Rubrivivax sp.]|nr:O-antigen ligase family protein [Rubrivivax sp.]